MQNIRQDIMARFPQSDHECVPMVSGVDRWVFMKYCVCVNIELYN